MTELLVRRLHPDAAVPTAAYDGDAGLDLASVEEAELGPGERRTVATGIAVVNSPGLIDSGYRGEIRVVLLNTDASETFRIAPGDRIAQLVVLALPQVRITETDELPGSERAHRGFGSSAVGSPP